MAPPGSWVGGLSLWRPLIQILVYYYYFFKILTSKSRGKEGLSNKENTMGTLYKNIRLVSAGFYLGVLAMLWIFGQEPDKKEEANA